VVSEAEMITRERAIELVESLLVREGRAGARELAVHRVEEHTVGWLVFWNTREYARSRDPKDSLVGIGPYLVDRQDGSIHHIPATTWVAEDWQALYLRQIKGIRPPDPLTPSVRALVDSSRIVAAMSHLRKQAPHLSPQQARAYVAAVRHGAEPPEELANLTRSAESDPPLSIETLAGPVQPQSD
jgi:hypothetical protein